MGHLGQMAAASGVDAVLDVAAVPVLPGVRELVKANAVAGGTRRNLEWTRPRLVMDGIDEADALILADAQTSGGLLFGAEPERAASAVAELTAAGVPAARIGEARAGDGRVVLR